MESLGNEKLQKSCKKYNCYNCDYITSRKSSYDKHILTYKHTCIMNGNLPETNSCKKLQTVANNNNYSCKTCNKVFSNRSGLWKHKNKEISCLQNKNIISECDKEYNEPSDKELMMMLIKQNSDLIKEQTDIKQIILELVLNLKYFYILQVSSHLVRMELYLHYFLKLFLN